MTLFSSYSSVYLKVEHSLATLAVAFGWSQSDLDSLVEVKAVTFTLE